ncbi:MAG: polynucleotide adenylyltransferase PcnB [Candidatus Binataceae bacterium]
MEPRILERAEHPISRRDIHPNVLKVLYRLTMAGHTAGLVGGGVRDLMIGRKPKDFDIATSAHPQEIRDLFRNSRLIGRRFRLVHVFFGLQNIEVSTFRKLSEAAAESHDPVAGHENTFGTPEEDAFRRDFTVNALFYDAETFRVIDYTGGIDDLDARLIRTIGDPDLRVREDPIRMLRAVRFAAKLGFEIEPATRDAIVPHCEELKRAAVPRLVEETFRTLAHVEAVRALVLMAELGLLEVVLPELAEHFAADERAVDETTTVRNLRAYARATATAQDPGPPRWVLLAALFLDLHRCRRESGGSDLHELVAELRRRGFAKAETERMRLALDAFDQLIAPSRRTRRLRRRPYYEDARRFFELMAPNYGAEAAAIAREFAPQPERHYPQAAPPSNDHRRRRRRHRRGRRRPDSTTTPPLPSA